MGKKLTRNGVSANATITTATIPAGLADSSLPFPKLIVFDLDYTLWPFWVDTHVTPPLKPNAQHTAATDRYGEDYAFYVDVPSILQMLPYLGRSNSSSNGGETNNTSKGQSAAIIKLGLASRTSAPNLARDLLKMLHLPPALDKSESDKSRKAIDVFDGGMEIYPGSKIKHFETLQKRTGIAFEDMLFFDDEHRNQETERLGLTMRLVKDGVTWEEVERGVDDWRRRRGFARAT